MKSSSYALRSVIWIFLKLNGDAKLFRYFGTERYLYRFRFKDSLIINATHKAKVKIIIFGWTLVKFIFFKGHKLLETKHSVFHAVHNRKKKQKLDSK